MNTLSGFFALLGLFATHSVAHAHAMSNAQSTQTLDPEPLGSATSDGTLLVSMNYCSVIQNTVCQVSIMTSGAPQVISSAAPIDTSRGAVESPPNPTRFSIPTSAAAGASKPVETKPPSYNTDEITTPVATASESMPTGAPAVTSHAQTAAASGIRAVPGAAWGAAILAVALVF